MKTEIDLAKFWDNYHSFNWGEIIYKYWLERIGGKVEGIYIDICNN